MAPSGCKRRRHTSSNQESVGSNLVSVRYFTPMSNQPDDVDDAKQWPPRLEELFIRLLADEVSKDKLGSGLIKPSTWGQIDNAIHTQSGQRYTVPKLKQKYQRLRTKHREFSQLLEHTGFGWNPDSNTVTAEEDTWQNYLKAHPKAKMFKKRGCEHYSLLGLIFNKSTATGKLARASTQGPLTSDMSSTSSDSSLEDDLDELMALAVVHMTGCFSYNGSF